MKLTVAYGARSLSARRYATFWMVFDKRHVTQYS